MPRVVEYQLAEEALGFVDRQTADLRQRALGRSAKSGWAECQCDRRACGLSRWPWQSGQRITFMNFSSLAISDLLFAPRYLSSSSGMMPVERAAVLLRVLARRARCKVMCSSPVPQSQRYWCSRCSSCQGVSVSVRRQVVLALDRVGHALVDVPLPAAQSLSTGRPARCSPGRVDFSGAVTSFCGIEAEHLPRPSHS